MCERARAVTAKFNQDGVGRPAGDVTISTLTPLSSGSDRGAS